MLNQLLSGSASLRKLAASQISGSAKVVGTAAKLLGKGVTKGVGFAVKHPAAAIPLLAVPGGVKRWRTEVAKGSPFSPQNMYPTDFWRR